MIRSSWYSRKAPGGTQRGDSENRGKRRGEPKIQNGKADNGLTESDVGENEMEELILICEDSVEGILTAIYRIYEWKLCDKRVKIQTGASDLWLFAQYREVAPDAECAVKVARTLQRRLGEQAWEAISYALVSEEADKGQAVYETVAAGLSGRIRGPLLQALAEPCIHRVFALSRSVHRVRERVLQFLRFQEITGAPQNTRRKPVDELCIPQAQERMRQNNITRFVVHAPYIINLANTVKPEVFSLAVEFLAKEIERTEAMGSDVLILHPGSHVGAGTDAGIHQIIEGLNEVLSQPSPVRIALETMAGKGSEIGKRFEELAAIYDGVRFPDRLRVCFDTCHVHDAGYDLTANPDLVLDEFDKTLGKDQIAVFHINDSKNERGASKDRHADLGTGQIGFDPLYHIVHHPDFLTIPKILETPWYPDPQNPKKLLPPYRREIAWLRAGRIDT